MKLAVLSDTHVRLGGRRALPATALPHLRRADVILHAGDLLEAWFLDELAEHAPVHAVLGNNDLDPALRARLPERLVLELDGVRVGLVHDSGAGAGRESRMGRWFPGCQLVVFGHSHAPLDGCGHRGQRLLNPGSACDRRAQPRHTMALVDVEDGTIASTSIIPLD